MTDFNSVMESQKKLQKAYKVLPLKDETDRNAKLKDMLFSLEDELHECLREFDWRSWTVSNGRMNKDRVKDELRDAFQFFVNCMLIVGMTPEELFSRTEEKQIVNWRRLENSYSDRLANEEDTE